MKKFVLASLVALGLAATPALAESGIKVGLLTCNVEGGVGWVIGSSKDVDCVYQPAGGGHVEHYSGRIGKFGVDIGVTGNTTIAWAVFAPGKVNRGALKGSYSGVMGLPLFETARLLETFSGPLLERTADGE